MAWKNCIFLLGIVLTCAVSAQVDYSSIQSTDCSSCNAEVLISFPSPADYSLLWSWNGIPLGNETGNSDNVNLTSLCPGIYDFQLTVNNQSFSEIITIGTLNNPSGTSEIAICSTDPIVNLIDFMDPSIPGGGWWTNISGDLISATIDPELTPSGYYVYWFNEGSCNVPYLLDLNVNAPANPGITTTYLICETYQAFPLFDALFGNPDPNGIFYNPGGIPDDGIYNPATDQTTLFTYQIDTVPGCAVVISTLFVIENQLPYPGISSSITVCPDALPFVMFDYLQGNPDAGGLWYNALNQLVGPIFDPAILPAGTYTYRLTAATPCTPQSSTLTINFNNGIDAGQNNSAIYCSNQSSVDLIDILNGTPDAGGIWSGPEGPVPSGQFNPAIDAPGVYSYLVQAVGCQDELAEVTIDVEYFPLAGNDQSFTLCGEQLLELNDFLSPNTSAGGEWLDQNGLNVGNVQILEADEQYIFTYEVYGLACPDDDSQIEFNIEMLADAGEDLQLAVCADLSQIDLNSLVDFVPGQISQWYDSNMQPVSNLFIPDAEGSFAYTYQVVGSPNCPSDEALIEIDVELPLAESSSLGLDLCNTAANVFPDNYLPDGFPLGGVWSQNGVNLPFPVIDPDDFPSGTFLYQAPQIGACPAPQFSLNINTFLQADAGSDGIIERCFNETGIVLSDLPDSDADTNGNWWFNDEQIIGNSFVPVQSGTLEYIVDSPAPCNPDLAEWQVIVLPIPGFEAGNDISACAGASAIQIGEQSADDFTFLWSPADRLDDPNSPNPLVSMENLGSQTEEITFIVEITDGVCSNSDTVDVSIYPLPLIDAGEDEIICENQTIEIIASGGDNYTWNTNAWLTDNLDGSASVTPLQSSWFHVTGFNDFGCPGTDSVFVEVREAPELILNLEPVAGCAPFTISLEHESDNEIGTFYYWMIGDDIQITSNTITLEEPGVYSVTLNALGINGCSAQATLDQSITVYPSPEANFDYSPEVITIYDQSILFENNSIDADFWEWQIDSLFYNDWSPEISIAPVGNDAILACLSVTNDFGCSDSLCRYIIVESDLGIFVPNAFSPNQDGRNEYFYPVVYGFDDQMYLFQIFDRWGMLLFESTTPGEGWSGNYLTTSELVPPDIYVWQLYLGSASQAEKVVKRGHVSIIR